MLSKINRSRRCFVFSIVFGVFMQVAPGLASKLRDQERHKMKEQVESPNSSRMKFDFFLHSHKPISPLFKSNLSDVMVKPESVGVHPWSSNELDEKLNPRFTSFSNNMEELILPKISLSGYEFQLELIFGRIYNIRDVSDTHGLYAFDDSSHPALILNPSSYGLTHNWSDIKRDLFESNSQRNIYHPFIDHIQDFEYVYDWSERLSITLGARNISNRLYSTENPLDIEFRSWSSMFRLSLQ